jgi:hypothetical protein
LPIVVYNDDDDVFRFDRIRFGFVPFRIVVIFDLICLAVVGDFSDEHRAHCFGKSVRARQRDSKQVCVFW